MTDRRRRFEAQILLHLDAAYRFARWLSATPGHADDVVQDAVLRAFRSFDAFKGGDARAWLFAIVRNCHATAIAQQRQRAFVSLDHEVLVTPDAGPEDVALQQDASQAVARLLSALAPEHREVLVLRELEEMSYAEIADVLEIPLGTVMSRLARARCALKALTANPPGAQA